MFEHNGAVVFPTAGSTGSPVMGEFTATVTRLEPASQQTENYLRVHLASGAHTFTIAALDITSFGVTVGDSVELSWRYASDTHPPAATRLSMRRAGQLAFSYKLYGEPMPEEGFSYAWGAVQCQGEWVCATWDSKKLRLTGPCGDTVELGTNEPGVVCGYEVLPGYLMYRYPEYRDNACGDHAKVGIELTIARAVADDESDAGTR